MENKEAILDVDIRAFGEMVVEILRNEGIDAILKPGDSITSALGSDRGTKDWTIIVPFEHIEKAMQILDELRQAGEIERPEDN